MEILSLVMAYLLGAIPFAYLTVRIARGRDIRRIGSRNVGTTNALRAAGPAWGVLTLLLDSGKGYVAVTLMSAVTQTGEWVLMAALAALLGHIFPVFLRFEGGKGAATALGAFSAIEPRIVICAVLVFLVVVVVSRYVSLGSMSGAAAFPIFAGLFGADWKTVVAGIICALLIIWRHSANIQRILQGTENRFVPAGK